MARGTRGRAAGINSVQFELVFTNPTLIIISPDSGTLENSNHIFTHEKKSLNTLLVKYYNDYLDMLSSEQGKYGVSNL